MVIYTFWYKIPMFYVNFGWFQRIKGTYKGQPQITYLVGKQAVASSRHAVLRVKESNIENSSEE